LPYYRLLSIINNVGAIASSKLHIEDLITHFEENETFKTKEITAFYRQIEKDLKKTTINWRIYDLVQKGILQRIGRGTFKLGKEKRYTPEVSSKLKSVFNNINEKFPYLNLCIWNTSILNEFMVHQPLQFYTLVETDKEATTSVFHYLKEQESNVFLEPGREILEYYIPENERATIIQPLVSETPTQKVKGVNTPTLEKVLVDIFCDPTTFSAFQGSEQTTIFKEAFNKYTVNRNKLIRYADRRGNKKEIINYLEKSKISANH
jgi:hypothetical protein